ncbi:hypothetical protein I8J34_15505 [Denitromonas sp. IR12]|uniref:Uncharacterized protein n=2 Tax=Denitromonas iodatirespirans TaxID=2795389 RepID=A0A944DCL7_DENI1|nr:hypothetical protein [Denitromonas iodatirespirans]
MLSAPLTALAAAEVSICYNYGCVTEAPVRFDDAALGAQQRRLATARTAEEERQILAEVIGWMYREAGKQSPIHADRAGDFLDDGVYGRMDCIDHATTTTRLLAVLEARGALRFHRLLPQARRTRFVLFQHFSAVVEEIVPAPQAAVEAVPDHVPVLLALCDCDVSDDLPKPAPEAAGTPGARYVIDTWFYDHGTPAVVLPLAAWLDGEGPNVQ